MGLGRKILDSIASQRKLIMFLSDSVLSKRLSSSIKKLKTKEA